MGMETMAQPTWRYICERCRHEEQWDFCGWRCSACGGAFAISGIDPVSPSRIERDDPTLWRYSRTLPVARSVGVLLGEGMTPLLRGSLAGHAVWFKCDHLLPTGSFKDRGAAVLITHLKSLGVEHVIVDSSGNAAAAMAGYAAASGLSCTIYAPAATSAGKLVQARAFGATIHLVEGNREAVADAAQIAAEADAGAFYASHNWHAVFVEGVKTWALEVREQLSNRTPDVVFVPTGGGSAFVGAWAGFHDELPALVAAQPAACAPIVAAWKAGLDTIAPVSPGVTIAEGTRIGAPARERQIMRAIASSGGWAAAVDEEEIRETLRSLWGQGFYIEPTAAVGAAAFVQAVATGRVGNDDDVVVLLTGNGLKATDTIASILEDQPRG